MDRLQTQSETGCCPRFDPEPWDQKEITWKDMLFVKDHVRCLFHIPLNFGKVMVRNMEKIVGAGAESPETVVLSDEKSQWGADVFISVTKEVPNSEMKRISGTFMTKVFEGPYKDAGKWYREMNAYVESKGRKGKRTLAFYTTCPKCAKVYGKNYTVMLTEV
jgi:hypothetical protein